MTAKINDEDYDKALGKQKSAGTKIRHSSIRLRSVNMLVSQH